MKIVKRGLIQFPPIGIKHEWSGVKKGESVLRDRECLSLTISVIWTMHRIRES